MERNKLVYQHVRESDNTVFYIGMGNKYRPYQKGAMRSAFWNRYVDKHGSYRVEIIKENLTQQEAWDLEIKLIKKHGRRDLNKGTLVNMTNGGGGFVRCSSLNKGVICLNTGIIFESIRKYCEHTGKIHSTVSMFLNGAEIKEHYVRFVENGNIVWETLQDKEFLDRKKHTHIIDSNIINSEYDYTKDNYEQKRIDELVDKINNLSFYERNILNLIIVEGYSFDKLAKATDIGRSSLYNTYRNALSKVKGEDYKSYNAKKINVKKLMNFLRKKYNRDKYTEEDKQAMLIKIRLWKK